MIKPIKPNIGLWISSEPLPESLQMVKIFLAESYLLYISSKRTWTWNKAKNWRVQAGVQPKIWDGHGPPLEPPVWRYHCSVTYVTRQWRSYHENFSFIVT